MKKLFYLIVLISITFLIACSTSQETTQQSEKKEPDVYVFDDIAKDEVTVLDTVKTTPPIEEIKAAPVKTELPVSIKKFIIQLGAFTSKERAESFINENKNKTEFIMNIIYREQIKLFAVQIPPFATKEEAEKVRNSLWQIPAFKDAFIITLE